MEYKIIRVVCGEKGVGPKSADTFPELEELVNIEMEKPAMIKVRTELIFTI